MRRLSLTLLLLCVLCAFAVQTASASALGANRNAYVNDGKLRLYPVAASTHVYKGALVMLNSSGYVVPAADTASGVFVGLATHEVNNTGAAGAASVTVQTYGECVLTSSGLSQASLGAVVYATDDQTVATSSTNHVVVGRITYYLSTTSCRVAFVAPGYAGNATITGTLAVGGAATLSSTLDVAGATTLAGALCPKKIAWEAITETPIVFGASDYGLRAVVTISGPATATLPANGAPAGSWFEVILCSDSSLTISAATADTLITNGDLTADSVAFSTTAHKIGSHVLFFSNGTYWIVINLGDTTMTIGT